MPRTTELFRIERVDDDDTGIYEQGELDYSVPVTTQDWLEENPEQRGPLAAFLRHLAECVEKREAPFRAIGRSSKEEEP